MEGLQNLDKKFSSPHEELDFLRAQILQKERELRERGENPLRERIIQEKVAEYRDVPTEKVLDKNYAAPAQEAGAVVLKLSPEAHDDRMAELLAILQKKGVRNALSVVSHLGNPHLDDDFERFLVQYIKAGFPIDIKDKDPLVKGLKMTLFEVAVSAKEDEKDRRPLKELLSSMEQFYSGMLSLFGADKNSADYFTMEIAVANHSDQFVFYVGVPDSKKALFEKQVLSVFHDARIQEKNDDYNIFSETGVSVASVAKLKDKAVWPIKTYENFDHDPLTIILNSFSKIDRDGEGAAIQLVFKPTDDVYTKRFKGMLTKLQDGKPVKEVVGEPEGLLQEFAQAGKHLLFGLPPAKADDEDGKKKEVADKTALEQVEAKIATPIVEANIRLVASAADEGAALGILADLESAFNQFTNTRGNAFEFKRQKKGDLTKVLHNFSYRQYSEDDHLPLSLREITSFMHFPVTNIKSAPQLKTSAATTAPAPIDMPNTGILLGKNIHRNAETTITFQPEDRLRHFYVIGQTGTGKTTLLKNMIVQDIKNGEGVCMIDPHGSDIQDVLANIPKERYQDVIYFDPAYTDRPMGLNMLEYDTRFPEQKTFVVNELFSIFQKLYGAVPESMGPMFEQYFRNATMLVIEDPETGNTLLDVSRVMSNKAFRELKISRCKNPIVVQFWKEIAEKAGGEASLANIVPYITSKFDVFLSNEIMRPIIAQEKSSFNFRQIMDEKKILLVNLSKGRLGDINANLIGLILVGKILMAALSRVDSIGKNLPSFYLYIDEFQNITTNSIATILSEARKYKLSLTIAHQFIAQLEENIKNAVFGNVGSLAAFRVGAQDAEVLEKQFAPVFSARDLMGVENRNAYLKLLVHGSPARPFSMLTLPPFQGNSGQLEALKQVSYLSYGGDRAIIEEAIMKKFQKTNETPQR